MQPAQTNWQLTSLLLIHFLGMALRTAVTARMFVYVQKFQQTATAKVSEQRVRVERVVEWIFAIIHPKFAVPTGVDSRIVLIYSLSLSYVKWRKYYTHFHLCF